MDYKEMLMHGAAGMQGMSQGMMSSRAASKFNAGAGGYQDLYKRNKSALDLAQQQAQPRINEMKRKYGDLLNEIDLESLERGQQPTQRKADPAGSFGKGLGVGMKMFGGGGASAGAGGATGGITPSMVGGGF